MTDAETRHTRGLLVVILLAVVFFALLSLIILKMGDVRPIRRRTETLTVLPMTVRIRTEPNARAAVVATATTGETVTLLEDQGTWVRVQTRDGLSGWAERASLERTAERARRLARFESIRRLPALAGITTDRAQLFAGPGMFYPLIGELPEGTSVRVFTRDHDFYAIEYRNQIAYADVEAVDVTASGSPQLEVATAQPPPTETTASAEPPPFEPPLEIPPLIAPEDLVDHTGAYAAVPPGGTQPAEVHRVIPVYPVAARRAGAYGSVVIRGIVRRDGTIDEVEIIKDLPHGLGQAARDAVRRWRFRPATYQGDPIDVYYTVTVNFRLQ